MNDISELTSGHKGLTCLLGKALDEKLRDNGGSLPTLEQWKDFCTFKITHFLQTYPTMEKMITSLRQKSELAWNARKFLSSTFLLYPNKSIWADDKSQQILKWLYSEGCLSSEIHRNISFDVTHPVTQSYSS
eukprot:TRINITY_DN5771_c0_g1_i1.p1 TRINITY_DN5771_c0_g1~~TRINITY_DN5771_c0_g1_i1.p1  ORF type:complete len:132 (-),score=20.87 TRINITY_DN5771_c0_g1_i1:171-566(-)